MPLIVKKKATNWHTYFFIYIYIYTHTHTHTHIIGICLTYNVSSAQQGDSVIDIHIYYFWDYFPL